MPERLSLSKVVCILAWLGCAPLFLGQGTKGELPDQRVRWQKGPPHAWKNTQQRVQARYSAIRQFSADGNPYVIDDHTQAEIGTKAVPFVTAFVRRFYMARTRLQHGELLALLPQQHRLPRLDLLGFYEESLD